MRIRKALVAFCLWVACTHTVLGQLKDTLPTVHIYSMPWQKYAVGSKIVQMDSSLLAVQNHTTLATVLQQSMPIHFREYGNGMLATLTLRGTSPNHTALLWNGININAATLGQTDFATIPATGQSNVSVQYGAASTLFGSDAIGGAIHLQSEPTFVPYQKIAVQQNFGSANRLFTTLSHQLSNGKIENKIHLFYLNAPNNFLFKNIAKFQSPLEKQQNAQIQQIGALQEINLRIRNNSYLSFKTWYNNIDRQLQPSMAVNNANETQKDDNLRLMLDYFKHSAVWVLNLKVAYLYDELFYNQTHLTITNRLINQIQHEKKFSKRLNIKNGINLQHIAAQTRNYANRTTENRVDVFSLAEYQITSNWVINVHARQNFVDGRANPFTPALHSKVKVRQIKNLGFTLKGSVARSYRVPTLNERFWQPGGNPNIKPEDGVQGEIGFLINYEKQPLKINIEITHYQSKVNDWIIWLPQSGSIWSPINIQKVHSRGAEVYLDIQYKHQKSVWQATAQYAYTRANNTQPTDINDNTVGKQLAYMPMHKATWQGKYQYQHYFINLQANYTSRSYTSLDNLRFVEGFELFHIHAGKNFVYKKNNFNVFLSINNLLNKSYQVYELRAMPLRNYQISLRYQLTK